jgi:Fe2+ or Zn2+ uptake regulation protein
VTCNKVGLASDSQQRRNRFGGLRWHDRHVPADEPHEHEPSSGPAALRDQGRRLTRQRQAIWDTLVADPQRHLSADEIVERVRDRLPQVNASTVYRTLDLLVDEGLLLRTDLGADRAYYEPAHEHPHHHLVCERCGAVEHFHDDALGDLPSRLLDATGYALGTREISLFGLCPACRADRG